MAPPPGHGEAIYQIGVEDDGTVRGITQEQLDASIETLKLIAAEIDADATLIRERDGLSCARPHFLHILYTLYIATLN
eukprot:COSAG02_NODE_30515_length_549_cov_1.262222_1_plen_78_part_00